MSAAVAGREPQGRTSLFTIPVHRPFADALAAGLLRQHSRADDPLALARGLVLLPNSRAVTALRDAFVRLAGGALLLPRLVAVGDSDLDASAGTALDRIDTTPLPPVIDPVHRRLELAAMVREEKGEPVSASEALALADSLARALDALIFEERSLGDMLALKAEDLPLAEHWEAAFHMLTRLSVRWPARLTELGLIDRAAARNYVLERTASLWRSHGLPVPWLTAAGITTSAPAIARLLGVIARTTGGSVIFPHLDIAMDDADWALLGDDPQSTAEDRQASLETHPQYPLKLLLSRMNVARGEVDLWPDATAHDGDVSRVRFISEVMAPAVATQRWPTLKSVPRLPGVTAIACASPAEEAQAIALAMRETLETPGKTAALVTPDRAIATRVAGHLARWGIVVDDSAGQPLAQTPPGALLIALAAARAARFGPVSLLALLGHPLVRAGDARLDWLDGVRSLDLALRGPRPRAGLSGISRIITAHIERLRAAEIPNAHAITEAEALVAWWAEVAGQLAPLDSADDLPLADALTLLRQTLSSLAGDGIYSRADGRALADLLSRLDQHAGAYAAPVAAGELPGLLATLMADVAVRPPGGGTARLFIWGLIEARLQRADRMILAGLNEGQWPQPPAPDPWLSPGIRRRLGLPGLERQIGLSSHDFAGALGAGEVILTRAVRDGGAPTIASRLLLRIDALTGAARPKPGTPDFGALAAAMDASDSLAQPQRPAPNPPVALRGDRLSASSVDGLLADPFSWYAKEVLRLFPLDPVDDEPDAKWRGILVHDLLEAWVKGGDWNVDTLVAAAKARLAQPDIAPLLRAVWGPRLLAAIGWAGQAIVDGQAAGRVPILSAVEQRGELEIGGIRLSGKADRIDRLPDGTLAVVDYKTGSSPGKPAVAAGFALQLGLLGALAQGGAFADAHGPVTQFEYWRLNKNKDQFGWIDTPFYKKAEDGVQGDEFIDFALARFAEAGAWLTTQQPFAAKAFPEWAPYADYDQLMRLEEWYGVLSPTAADAP